MKKGYWVIRTYVSGTVGEKIKFWIPGERPTRSERRLKREIKKQEQNDASAEKTLARLLNENFSEGDILIGLDYSSSGYKKIMDRAKITMLMSEEEKAGAIFNSAAHELYLCLRRVKRDAQKKDIKLKHVYITSDMDGETGESVRVHHHLVINAASLELFQNKWTLGGVNWKPLSRQDDYTPIAHYFIKQVRRIPDFKKYGSSRNLIRPIPRDRIAKSNSELRVPVRCKLLHRNEYRPYMPQYMRYSIPGYVLNEVKLE